MFDPNFILIFDSLIDYENIDKKVRSLSTISSSNVPFGSSTSLQNIISSSKSSSTEINLINCDPNQFEGYNVKYFTFVNSNSSGNSSNMNQIPISMARGFNVGTLFFNMSFIDCLKLWIDNRISTYDYLIFLNYQSGRAFADCAQYPVFPWVIAPSLEETRKMSLPMGQQSEKRAQHYEETYNESLEPNKYYYGCHYSLPGAVFWFMMRIPPFSYFLWDMNEGWDDNQRMFYSVNESYLSASVINQTDLKEPIPEIYSVPEVYENISKLDIIDDRQNVALPEWADNSPILFTEVFRKYLEKNDEINSWIDLIFGYKQQGEAALKAKNLFLPSAYHSSTAEMLMIDANAYEDQVINFGQCPRQLFNKEHPARSKLVRNNIRTLTQKINPQIIELYYSYQKQESNNNILLRSPHSSSSNLFLLASIKRTSTSSSTFMSSSSNKSRKLLSDQPSSLPANSLLNECISPTGSLGSQKDSPIGLALSSADEANLELAPSDNEIEISSNPHSFEENQNNSYYDSYTAVPRITDRTRRSANIGSLPPTGSVISNESDSQSILSPQSKADFKGKGRTLIKRSQVKALHSISSYTRSKQKPKENENKENSLLFSSYVPFSACFSNPESFQLGKNATVLPEKSVSIPPLHDYFITLEEENETITVRKTINNDLMCSITSSEFCFIHSISISNDGVFISFSFESGLVKIYFVYYELRVPRYIEHVASFIGPCGCRCRMSSILSQDFICASQFGSEIIMWNFATGYVHRIIDFGKNRSRSFISQSESGELTEKEISMNEIFNYYEDDSPDSGNVNMPIDMIFDNFDGSLTVLFNNRIEQFSVNGKKLRTYRYDPEKSPSKDSKDGISNYSSSSELAMLQNEVFEFTCFALFPFDFTFDGRIFIIGNNFGGIDFVVASSDNVEEFILIGSKNHLFKSRVKNIFVSSKESKVWVCDDKKHAVELYIPIFEGITNQPSSQILLSNVQQADINNSSASVISNNGDLNVE